MGDNLLLTLGAFMLFGKFLLSTNAFINNSREFAYQSEFYVTSLSLAQSVIDEAKTKAFDQKTVTKAVPSRDSLTLSLQLGKDGFAEAIPNPDTLTSTGYKSNIRFNDVDDYNGYIRLVNTNRAGGYRIVVNVDYMSEGDPNVPSVQRTYCKRIRVTVSSPFTPQPVALTYLFTY